jgi:SAM-dependent methyltransferase
MTEDELSMFYPSEYWGGTASPDPKWIKSSQSAKIDFFRACSVSRGRILDVGCGSGWFLQALGGDAWDRFGVENGHQAQRIAAAAIGADRVFPEMTDSPLPEGYFDVVTFWSSLEHMNQPRQSLEFVRRLIKDGGTLIVQVPNAAGYQARLFKGEWFAFDVPRHRYHFSIKSINRLLVETGFRPHRTTTFSRDHNAHALRQSLKSSLKAVNSWPRYFLFCLTIPLIRPADLILSSIGGGATLTIAASAV